MASLYGVSCMPAQRVEVVDGLILEESRRGFATINFCLFEDAGVESADAMEEAATFWFLWRFVWQVRRRKLDDCVEVRLTRGRFADGKSFRRFDWSGRAVTGCRFFAVNTSGAST